MGQLITGAGSLDLLVDDSDPDVAIGYVCLAVSRCAKQGVPRVPPARAGNALQSRHGCGASATGLTRPPARPSQSGPRTSPWRPCCRFDRAVSVNTSFSVPDHGVVRRASHGASGSFGAIDSQPATAGDRLCETIFPFAVGAARFGAAWVATFRFALSPPAAVSDFEAARACARTRTEHFDIP